MAVHALSTGAPEVRPANDNLTPKGDVDLWHQIIKLCTSVDERLAVVAWQSRLEGQSALGFCDEILRCARARSPEMFELEAS